MHALHGNTSPLSARAAWFVPQTIAAHMASVSQLNAVATAFAPPHAFPPTRGASTATSAPNTPGDPAPPRLRRRHGRRHKPREWTLRAGQTQGETTIGFHNSSGQSRDHVRRRNYVNALLAKFDIVGTCELGIDDVTRDEMAANAERLHNGYKSVFALGTRPQTGMALLVSNRLETTRLEKVYDDAAERDPGHTLIAKVDVHGRLPLMVVVTHAPPDKGAAGDHKRAKYFEDLLDHIPEVDPRQPERCSIWMGDFNFTELEATRNAGADTDAARARARMLEAYGAVCARLGTTAGAGLEDAWSLVHPDLDNEDRDNGTSAAGRRIDRVLLDPRLVGQLPGLCDVTHIHQRELRVPGEGGKLSAAPDHKAVMATLCFSDTPRAPAAPRYDTRTLTPERAAEVEGVVLPLLKDEAADPETTEGLLQHRVAELFKRYRKEDRKAHNARRHHLVTKLDACERALRGPEGKQRARARALKAQVDRHTRALHTYLQRAADVQRERRRREAWRRERGASKELFATMKPQRTTSLPVDHVRTVGEDGKECDAHGQDAVASAFRQHFSSLLTSAGNAPYNKSTLQPMLDRIAADASHRVTDEQAALLQPEVMFAPENFDAAMKKIAVDTSPGASGITTAFMRHPKWRALMAKHLSRLALQCYERGVMSPAMRESIISVLYKGGGKKREQCKSYRPVSLTDVAYRLLGKVVEMHMNKVIPTILSGKNIGFVPGARAETDTLTTAEVARYVHDGERRGCGPTGGVMVLTDLDKAYDRVQYAMLLDTLRAFGFPEPFVKVIAMMYNDLHAQMKVNGHVGHAFRILNGLRQGCPASCPLFLCVHEVFIRDLEADAALHGIEIPGALGESTEELKTRAYADDTKLFLRSLSEMPALLAAMQRWESASGQILSAEKLCIVLLGDATAATADDLPAEMREATLLRYGVDEIEKSVGVRVGTPQLIAAQWQQQLAALEKLATDVCAGRSRGLAITHSARSRLFKGGFISKLSHHFLVQAPPIARGSDNRRTVFENVIAGLQKLADRLVFGKYHGCTIATAQQPHRDGGFGHVNVEERLSAAWTALVRQLYDTSTPAPWKNIWWYHMRETYGPLTGPPFLRSTCTFQLLQQSDLPSNVQKLALRGWGELPKLQPMIQVKREPSKKKPAGTDSGYEWIPGVREDVSGASVSYERIWFNPIWKGAHLAFSKSIAETEREAVRWASEGLVSLKDMMNGTTIIGVRGFLERHPDLATLDNHDLCTALSRSAIPLPWRRALADGTAPTWGEDALPAGLLSDGGDEEPRTRQALHLPFAPTLQNRESVDASRSKQKLIYDIRMSGEFTVPRTFDRTNIVGGRHAHLYRHVPDMALNEAVGRTVKCIKHPAVPAELTETAWKAATSSFPFGPSKVGICKRATCPCNCGAPETVFHTFHECIRSRRIWELTTKQWRDVTGENKVKASDALITLLGDRTQTWLDDVEQSEFGALHEPWAVVHHCTLHAIYKERNRDAAPNAKPRRTAQQVYESAQKLVRRVMKMRWAEACAAERARSTTEGSSPKQLFRGKWEAPGFVAFDKKDRRPVLIFYMRDAARKRWRRNIQQGCSREQEHAPPTILPEGTVSIFTDGSAIYDKERKCWTNAGFGLTAVTGGDGHEHANGYRRLHEHCGPIAHGDEGAEQKTNNVAELVAFIHALRWARSPAAAAHPIVMRYDSKYAALITTGVYKAKKNKKLVATAQAEWKLTHAAKQGKLWMRHVKGHAGNEHNDEADRLAKLGCGGDRYYGPPRAD